MKFKMWWQLCRKGIFTWTNMLETLNHYVALPGLFLVWRVLGDGRIGQGLATRIVDAGVRFWRRNEELNGKIISDPDDYYPMSGLWNAIFLELV